MNSPRPSGLPDLRRPIMIAAFGGWNDAGDAATSAIEHLALTWDATDLREIDGEEFYDFQSTRPTIAQVDGVTRRIEWPTTSVSYATPADSDRDFVFVLGPEPNLRWRTFAERIVDLAATLDVELVVMVGALLADTPHTRPVPVSGSAETTEAAQRFGLSPNKYEGPTGITGVLQDAFVQAGVPSVSLWAAVPHYIAHPPNPKAVLALLNRLEPILEVSIDTGPLAEQSQQWQEAVDEMMSEDEDMSAYVHELEENDDEAASEDALTEVDGDTLAAEFERYLRRRNDQP
ncbi:PAC2 family protein [Gordonia sp. (in: high G+C Gram-positive bacteria)]|uniref:PAC2 family protein n=1 Tax=Gordonia sp. (in: high G+C Gram-positive bacteria) TaxID=84139 RepID=UPI003F999C7F